MDNRRVGNMIVTYHIVVEDSEGNQKKITDFPKDVEQILDDFITDLDN
jgi:hypothetical protein